MAFAEAAYRERSISELFGELATETSTLVRQEVTLATTEIAQKATHAAKKSLIVVVGGVLAGVSLLALAAGLILVLGLWLPLWAAALIVSAVVGIAAWTLCRAGMRALTTMDLRPTQTLASLKDNKTWATAQIH